MTDVGADFYRQISSIHWQANYTGDHFVSAQRYERGAGTYDPTAATE